MDIMFFRYTLFYEAIIHPVFGVLDRVNSTLVTCVILCSNAGIYYHMFTGSHVGVLNTTQPKSVG
jgi:hypothetical protein